MRTMKQESLNLDVSHIVEDTALSVLHTDDIITLDAALFACPARALPLTVLGISVYLAEITPEVARILLKTKNTNRSIKLAQLNRIKRAIEKSRWEINGETIIFDHDGRLVEGQHRLQAVVDTNTTIWTLVVRGIDRERFKTMGQGSKRTAGDILGIQGVKNATNIAAALRWVYRYETDQMTNAHPNITDDELTDTLPMPMRVFSSQFLLGRNVKVLRPLEWPRHSIISAGLAHPKTRQRNRDVAPHRPRSRGGIMEISRNARARLITSSGALQVARISKRETPSWSFVIVFCSLAALGVPATSFGMKPRPR